MPASFKCSECGFATSVKDELAGKKIKCPKCKAVGLVGSGGGAAPAGRRKAGKAADSEDALMALNLDSYQDVEPEEGEILDESQKPKAPKKKKKKGKGKALDPQVKALALLFSLISSVVLGGLIYLVGLPALEEYEKEKPFEKDEQAEKAAPNDNAGG